MTCHRLVDTDEVNAVSTVWTQPNANSHSTALISPPSHHAIYQVDTMLTGVDLVLLYKLPQHDLLHEVADILAEFLIQDMSLHQACALNAFQSTDLQDWVWRRGLRDVERSRWTMASLLHTNRHYFQWEFVHAMRASVRCGSVEKAQWLLDHFPGCPILESAVTEAARSDRLAVLKLFESAQASRDVTWSAASLKSAASAGNWDIVHWLDERVSKPAASANPWIVQLAVAQNNADQVKWAIERGYKVRITSGFNGSVDGWKDCMEIIRYLLHGGHGDRESILRSGMEAAAKVGDLAFLKWLEVYGTSAEAFDSKADSTDLVSIFSDALEGASFCGHLHAVQWLLERMKGASEYVEAPALALLAGARGGQLGVVQWLYSQYSHDSSVTLFGRCDEEKGDNVMDVAAENGHLDVLVYLHHNANENEVDERLRCTHRAISNATANGHFKVVKWLHDYLKAGCTSEAMDGAAANGNLQMLQWLHIHTDAGCTTTAMDSAAGEGRLDIVQWLHENRTEGCSSAAMENAAKNGHLEVVKWLYQNRSEGDLENSLRGAVSDGYLFKDNLPTVQWLLPRCANVPLWPLIRAAMKLCRFEIALYLHTQLREVDDEETILDTKRYLNRFLKYKKAECQYMLFWLEEEYPHVECPSGPLGSLQAPKGLVQNIFY